MKHLNKLLGGAAIVAAAAAGTMLAETFTDYTVDFNTPISTSQHDFQVAQNWKHVVGKYNDGYSDYYMSYSYKADEGVGGSGCLQAYRQFAGDNQDNDVVYDLLVTPEVAGTISLDVRLTDAGKGFLEFWSTDGTSKGELLKKVPYSELSTTDWTTVTYDVATAQRIGIRGEYVYMDNFRAAQCFQEITGSMSIVTAEPSQTSGVIYFNEQADGTVLVKYNVTVKNTGDITLTPGTKNYSISIFNDADKEVLGTTPVPFTLQPGETSEAFDVTATVPAAKKASLWPYSWSGAKLYLRENLGDSTVSRAQAQYKAYEPIFTLRLPETTANSITNSANLDFAIAAPGAKKALELYNGGTAPLRVTALELPAGYTTTLPAVPFQVEPGAVMPFDLTISQETGSYAGNILFTWLDKTDAEKKCTVSVTGHVAPEDLWKADLNG